MDINDYLKHVVCEETFVEQLEALDMAHLAHEVDEETLRDFASAMIEIVKVLIQFQDDKDKQVSFLYSTTLACMARLCLEFKAFNFSDPGGSK